MAKIYSDGVVGIAEQTVTFANLQSPSPDGGRGQGLRAKRATPDNYTQVDMCKSFLEESNALTVKIPQADPAADWLERGMKC
jgi:hypothetical protein